MSHCRRLAIVAVVATLLPLLAAQGGKPTSQPTAGPQTYKIDPIHSNTWFRIRHLKITEFYGRFNETEGTIVIDDGDPTACSVDARVKADSIDTHNGMRDKDLKSAEFFDVAKYPLITFKSTAAFRKTGAGQYEVKGDLTLHGVTRPLTLELMQTGVGPGLKEETRAGFETTFDIKRSDFGMTSLPNGLGDEVRLTVSVEGVRK